MDLVFHRGYSMLSAIYVHCNSQSTIRMTQSSVYNDKSKHIHRRLNTIKYLLSNIIIFIDSLKLQKNIMDLLTIGLSREFVYISSR
jgi:hypothetical protein